MKELPKLPRGMGGYDYFKDGIRFKKRIRYKDEYKDVAVYGKTITECNEKMQEKEREFMKRARRDYIPMESRTLEMLMEEWIVRYKKPTVKATTYDRIESTFNTHIKNSDLGNTQERAINSDILQDYINNLKAYNGIKLSHSSLKKVYQLLNQYFTHKFAKNPALNPMNTVNLPRKEKKVVNEELIIWDDNEMDMLTKLAYKEFIPRISGYQYGLLVSFLMWSFIRIGELAALKWEDIDFENGTLNINKQISVIKDRDNGGTKRIITEPKYSSVRKIVLPTPALKAIAEYKKRCMNYEYILQDENGIYEEIRVRRTYERMCKELGLKKHVTIHGLRHSGISYLLRHKVPVEVVSKMAGHSSISITLETYYSVIEEQKNDAMREFNKQFENK